MPVGVVEAGEETHPAMDVQGIPIGHADLKNGVPVNQLCVGRIRGLPRPNRQVRSRRARPHRQLSGRSDQANTATMFDHCVDPEARREIRRTKIDLAPRRPIETPKQHRFRHPAPTHIGVTAVLILKGLERSVRHDPEEASRVEHPRPSQPLRRGPIDAPPLPRQTIVARHGPTQTGRTLDTPRLADAHHRGSVVRQLVHLHAAAVARHQIR